MVPSVISAPVTAVGVVAIAPVTVRSATASPKPLTTSLKVKVTSKAAPSWVEGALMATSGATRSALTVFVVRALPLPAPSLAASAGTARVISARASPEAGVAGVMVAR